MERHRFLKVVEIHCTRFVGLLRHVYLLLERQGWPEQILTACSDSGSDSVGRLFSDVIPEGMDEKDKPATNR